MTLSQHEREAIQKARREYKAEWRRKNPDKIKAANDRYWLKKAKEYEQARTLRNGENTNDTDTN